MRYALFVALFLSGCSDGRHAKVEGILVPQADGLSSAPEGTTVKVEMESRVEIPSEAAVVRLAIHRDVPWNVVRDLRKRIIDAGKTPVLLVASNRNVGAIDLYEPLQDREKSIDLHVSAEGKVCVKPSWGREAKCVERKDQKHVDRAFTRELVREAVKGYNLLEVTVDVPPDLSWADVVRAVDGARTCCGLIDKIPRVTVI